MDTLSELPDTEMYQALLKCRRVLSKLLHEMDDYDSNCKPVVEALAAAIEALDKAEG